MPERNRDGGNKHESNVLLVPSKLRTQPLTPSAFPHSHECSVAITLPPSFIFQRKLFIYNNLQSLNTHQMLEYIVSIMLIGCDIKNVWMDTIFEHRYRTHLSNRGDAI